MNISLLSFLSPSSRHGAAPRPRPKRAAGTLLLLATGAFVLVFTSARTAKAQSTTWSNAGLLVVLDLAGTWGSMRRVPRMLGAARRQLERSGRGERLQIPHRSPDSSSLPARHPRRRVFLYAPLRHRRQPAKASDGTWSGPSSVFALGSVRSSFPSSTVTSVTQDGAASGRPSRTCTGSKAASAKATASDRVWTFTSSRHSRFSGFHVEYVAVEATPDVPDWIAFGVHGDFRAVTEELMNTDRQEVPCAEANRCRSQISPESALARRNSLWRRRGT